MNLSSLCPASSLPLSFLPSLSLIFSVLPILSTFQAFLFTYLFFNFLPFFFSSFSRFFPSFPSFLPSLIHSFVYILAVLTHLCFFFLISCSLSSVISPLPSWYRSCLSFSFFPFFVFSFTFFSIHPSLSSAASLLSPYFSSFHY